MPSSAIIAAAGSGKTTRIVKEALETANPVLLTTYTEENVAQIRDCIVRRVGCIPPHITVMSWFSFLLRDCIRPYQNQLGEWPRAVSIDFVDREMPVARRKADYFNGAAYVYADKAAEFGFESNKASGGMVAGRLKRIYSHIYIDEVQDLASYDLEIVEALITAGMTVSMVGDPRQGTYSTNRSKKNRQFRRDKVFAWLETLASKGLIILDEQQQHSHRCNQAICDFADNLFPDMPKTTSLNETKTAHDGIFQIYKHQVQAYIEEHSPTCLRYNRAAKTDGVSALNIGSVKGREYDRVLIFPTSGMKKYVKSRDPNDAGDKNKLYIAITRARHSVAFVMDT